VSSSLLPHVQESSKVAENARVARGPLRADDGTDDNSAGAYPPK
jgi:hypothetical protein